jgi:hypothetical protein
MKKWNWIWAKLTLIASGGVIAMKHGHIQISPMTQNQYHFEDEGDQ